MLLGQCTTLSDYFIHFLANSVAAPDPERQNEAAPTPFNWRMKCKTQQFTHFDAAPALAREMIPCGAGSATLLAWLGKVNEG
jgi:hypothetical protein